MLGLGLRFLFSLNSLTLKEKLDFKGGKSFLKKFLIKKKFIN